MTLCKSCQFHDDDHPVSHLSCVGCNGFVNFKPRKVFPGQTCRWIETAAPNVPWMLVEPHHLERLRAVAKRLFTENRLTGDEMRDAAQTIMSCIDNAIPAEEDVDP